jgi:alkanesulfonate monooxygenase SsuD/methylene tetrahydromethanopterin reductase-like flavin-dependent oxidoreductase (luciferase family)
VRIGVTVPMSVSDGPGRIPSWPEVRAYAEHAEAVGLSSLWVCDHLVSSPPGRPVEGIHEAWTILSALAASTSRVELGQLVMCAAFRSPALLAKMAATADAVSGGRLILGLGAGWDDAEFRAYGYPTDNRVSRFEEALEIVAPLLRGATVTFSGRYQRVSDAVLLPPVARTIPILVAANRPRMLRLTARHAHAWNTAWYGRPDGRLRRRLADLDSALDAEGRDPAALRRTVGVRLEDHDPAARTADELARVLEGYEALDFDDVILGLEPMSERSLERVAEALLLRG